MKSKNFIGKTISYVKELPAYVQGVHFLWVLGTFFLIGIIKYINQLNSFYVHLGAKFLVTLLDILTILFFPFLSLIVYFCIKYINLKKMIKARNDSGLDEYNGFYYNKDFKICCGSCYEKSLRTRKICLVEAKAQPIDNKKIYLKCNDCTYSVHYPLPVYELIISGSEKAKDIARFIITGKDPKVWINNNGELKNK